MLLYFLRHSWVSAEALVAAVKVGSVWSCRCCGVLDVWLRALEVAAMEPHDGRNGIGPFSDSVSKREACSPGPLSYGRSRLVRMKPCEQRVEVSPEPLQRAS